MHTSRIAPASQRGAASLIFVLLVALVVTASTNEVVKSIRNSQDIGTAVNATSHAQTGIWVAAEAMRAYLDTLSKDEILELGPVTPTMTIGMDASYGTVTADIISQSTIISDVLDQVEILLINKHAASKSSAKLRVVYDVNYTEVPVVPDPPTPTVQFRGGLTVSGGIELYNGGEPIDLTIDGDVTIDGVSTNPINEIHSTGKVTIGSNVTVDSIYADDDVELANTIVQRVRTLGTLETTGSATVADTVANGDVTIKATGDYGRISTRESIFSSGNSKFGVLIAGDDIVAQSAASIDSANAVGDITFQNWFRVDFATAMGNVNCVATGWKKTYTLMANGSLNNCPPGGTTSDLDGTLTITTVQGASNQVTPDPELPPRELPTTDIDVWQMNDATNYFVEYDSTVDRIKVTVNYVNGLTDGAEYYIADYSAGPPDWKPHYGYLCSTIGADGNCAAPATPTMPLCYSWGPWNADCITHDPSTNTFTLSPANTVPGIIFFDGNVEMKNGKIMSTILASGNIKAGVGSPHDHWAPNRAGYAIVCEGLADHIPSGSKSRFTAAQSTYYPTNLCDTENGVYTPLSIGNVALAAGGINPDTSINPDGDYTGGDIDLLSKTDIWGAVLAGNFLNANTGNVNIKGLVNAGANGGTDGTNELGGKTTIELQATDTYDPLDLPTVTVVPPPPPIVETNSTITWSRPL